MLILFVLQKKFYIPFSFILPNFKTDFSWLSLGVRERDYFLALNGILAIQKNKPLS